MKTDAPMGLSPTRRRLENGAIVLAKSSAATPAVAIVVSVPAGTADDPPELTGVAHFLSKVIDRGTAARDAEAIADLLDSRGVSLTAAALRHALVMTCTCLTEDFPSMLGLMADMIRNPSLPEREIETRRGEIVTNIRQDQDNPAMVAVEEELALLYPNGHPYGRRVKGTLESVPMIDRRTLVAAHRERFAPAGLQVICVGDMEPDRVVSVAERVFGDWQGKAVAPSVVPSPAKILERRQIVRPMTDKAQADIAYGFNTVSRSDPAYYALLVLNNVLGQYALGGRLGDNIRERQGMAYYVFSAFEPNLGEGPLVIRAGVNPANVDRTIAAIDEEVSRMAADGVTAEELAASKKYLVGSMPRLLETNAAVATFLHSCEQFGLGVDHDVRLPGLLNAVTLDEVNACARRFLAPERAAITVAGPSASEAA